MGGCVGCGAIRFVPNRTVLGQGELTLLIATESLGMNHGDVDALFTAFCKFDKMQRVKTKEGHINIYNFFLTNEIITHEGLARHIVSSCFHPVPHTDDVNFEQFLVVNWHMVTIPAEKLAAFFFKTFDRNHDGFMRAEEVGAMVDVLCGTDEKHKTHLQHALNSVGSHLHGLDVRDFEHLVEKSNSLLFPIFKMQIVLRECTVGPRFHMMMLHKAAKFTLDATLPDIIDMLGPTRKPLYLRDTAPQQRQRTASTAAASPHAAAGHAKVVPTDESKGSGSPGGHVDDGHQRGSSPKSDRIVDLFIHMRSHEMSATTPRTPRGDHDGEGRRPSSAAQRTPRSSLRDRPGSAAQRTPRGSLRDAEGRKSSTTTPRTPRGSLRDGEDRRPSSAAQRTPRGSHRDEGQHKHRSNQHRSSKRQSDKHHGEEHHSMELQSPRGEDDGEVSPLRKVSLGAFGYSGGQHHGKRSHGASERASQKALEEDDDDDEDVDNHVTIHAVGGKKQRGGKH